MPRKTRTPKSKPTAAEDQTVVVAAHQEQLEQAPPTIPVAEAPAETVPLYPSTPAELLDTPRDPLADVQQRPSDAVSQPNGVERREPPRTEGMWTKALSKMGPLQGGGVRDDLSGIRVDVEKEPRKGKPFARVLISAPDDRKFNQQERELLKENRFAFDEASWTIRKSAGNQELALRLVNRINKDRGYENRNAYIG